MLAVTSQRTLLTLSLALAACGGSAPDHTGYPTNAKEPWARAKRISLDDNFEGKADGQVSYPKRDRAKWFLLKLPIEGGLNAKLTVDPVTPGADVGFEILDAGFNVIATGENEEEGGQMKKERKVREVPRGEAYIHVYTLGRSDEADFKLRIKFTPRTIADPTSAYPNTIPNTPELAAVPNKDWPEARVAVRKPNHVPDKPTQPVKPPVVPVDTKGSVRGSVVEFSDTGSGVKIIINKGSANGIDKEWTGEVLQKGTDRAIKSGFFKIRNVKNDECDAVVSGVSLDDIQNNRSVRLKPPK
jgi:hypothetical protein